MGDLYRDEPRIGCCGATCGDSCPCCCDNVVYSTTLTMVLNYAWRNLPGQETCSNGSASVSIPLTNTYPDFNEDTGIWGPARVHPCSYIMPMGYPGGPVCGDYVFTANCRPGGEFADFCYDTPFYVTGANLSCVCKIGPPGPEPGHVGDGSLEPATCTVTAGTSKAGWVGGVTFTTNADCSAPIPGTAECGQSIFLNHLGIGSAPGDLTAFMKFGPCQNAGVGCGSWRCCDPFSMKFYAGGYVFDDPHDLSIWIYGPDVDFINCDLGIVHQQGVDYPLASISTITVTGGNTCVPTGPDTMRSVMEMSDERVDQLLRQLIAEEEAGV